MPGLIVRDLMVPTSDHASISADASVLDGILALEAAQQHELEVDPTRHRDRSVLALDDDGRVVGKLSMWTVLGCLEPRYDHVDGAGASSRAGARVGSARARIHDVMKHSHRWHDRLSVLAERTGHLRVGDLVRVLRDGEVIGESAPLEQAVHQLTAGHFSALLVSRGGEIVGVLRLIDVFDTVAGLIKGEAPDTP